ncbi:unnamed protein product [Prorocentrum cordatum]|uniref:Uncharacterized protein n=1 Tax=Prorocentrum cordatum TaxID=2364126 RepID=A0ABN9V6H5_9DINO|nr:unnamed protein product [Polarella glacialis]
MDTYLIVPRGAPPPPLEPARAKASEPARGDEPAPGRSVRRTRTPISFAPSPADYDLLSDDGHDAEQLRSQLATAADTIAELRAERDELRECGCQLTAAKGAIDALRAERDELRHLGSQLAAANDAIAKLRAERDEICQRESQRQLIADNPAVAEVRPSLKAVDRRHILDLHQVDDEQATGRTSTASSAKGASADVTALRLELAVKKKALQRARCALFDKDDQLDAKELELQHALMALRDTGLPSHPSMLLTD